MNREDYPLVLTAEHVADILGVSLRRAYEIMETEHFPLKRVGVRKYVTRERFFEWLETAS